MKFTDAYVDLDGVLGDFHTAALAVHGSSRTSRDWPKPGRELMNVLGFPLTPEGFSAFWEPIRAKGKDFWTDIEPFPWVHPLLKMVQDFVKEPVNVVILTGPASGKWWEAAGKIEWLERHGIKNEVCIHKTKRRLSLPDTVLIDDWEKQVEAFNSGAGEAILFPRPWGELHMIENPLEYVHQRLIDAVRVRSGQ